MLRRGIVALFALAFVIAGAPSFASGTPLGMVVDASGVATTFNTSTDTVIGSTAARPGAAAGSCSIVGNTGLFTNFNNELNLVQLDTGALIGAAVPISTEGEDTTIIRKHKRKFVVVSDGSDPNVPLSVLAVTKGKNAKTHLNEVSTFSQTSTDHDSVQRAPDNSLLTTSFSNNLVYRLKLHASGTLTDTGATLAVGAPVNLLAPKTGKTAIVLGQAPNEIETFAVPSMLPITAISTTDAPTSGVVRSDGLRVYVRTSDGAGNSTILAFAYDPNTGALAAAGGFTPPTFTSNGAVTDFNFGMEQLALNPSGTKLYVSAANAIKVYDAGSGTFLHDITDANIVAPTGLCVQGS
jgi:hypothetical protein